LILAPFEFGPVQLYDFNALRIPQVVGGQQAVISRSAGDFSPPASKPIRPGLTQAMPSVKFVNEKKTIEVPEGANLRKEALKAGLELYPGVHQALNCHGLRMCASCRVIIKKGRENVSRPGLFERLRFLIGPITYFAKLGHEEDLRLACATRVLGDIEVETQPVVNWHGDRFWG
jgi:ferredoxin